MRISYLTSTVSVLASIITGVGLLALSSPAYAGSSTTGTAIVYGSGSYGSYSGDTHKKHMKHKKHKKQKHKSRYITSISDFSTRPHHPATRPVPHVTHSGVSSYGSSVPACPVGSSRAADGLCMSTSTRAHSAASHTASHRAGLSISSRTHYSSAPRPQVVPFTTTVNNISNFKVPGMGANEYLSKTSCPTSVYNPEGGQVQGCYFVVKPVVRPRPVVRHQVHYQQIQVVRPVIYVRYPVPVAIPMPRPATICGSGMRYSRYGNAWPRSGGRCGGW